MGSGLVKARQSCYRTTSVVQSGCTTRDSELCNLVAQSRSCAIWLHNLGAVRSGCTISPIPVQSGCTNLRLVHPCCTNRGWRRIDALRAAAPLENALASYPTRKQLKLLLDWPQQESCWREHRGRGPIPDSSWIAPQALLHAGGHRRFTLSGEAALQLRAWPCRRSSGPDWRPHSPTNRPRRVVLLS